MKPSWKSHMSGTSEPTDAQSSESHASQTLRLLDVGICWSVLALEDPDFLPEEEWDEWCIPT